MEPFITSEKDREINGDEPILHAYLPILEYLSRCEDVSATMEKFHEAWVEADVIEFVDM
jgi:hypothetical protein